MMLTAFGGQMRFENRHLSRCLRQSSKLEAESSKEAL